MLFPKETSKNNSRKVEDKNEEVFVPEFDNVEDIKPLELSDEGRVVVNAALEKSNTAYKYFNAQNGKVREAQTALRQHHSISGDNNPEYVRLSNLQNTATQEMLASKQDYEVAKSVWENAKRRFGKKVTF